MTHLFLAMAHSTWGEASLGLRIAQRVRAAGQQAAFVIQPELQTLFEGTSIPTFHVPDLRGAALDAWIGDVVAQTRPASIVLADILMAVDALYQRQVPHDLLDRHGLPVIGIDPWNFRETDHRFEVCPGRVYEVPRALGSMPLRLVPIPFARPEVPCATCVLPEASPPSQAQRRATREALGLNGPTVLVCTAAWQHGPHLDPWMERVSRAVPALLVHQLDRLGHDVTVVHVGPRPLPWAAVLGDRYRPHRPLSAARFGDLVAACDLFVSPNAPATTASQAVCRGVPVVSLIHTVDATRPSALGDRFGPPTAAARAWRATHLPLYRFRGWPVSADSILSSVLADNPWTERLSVVELLDEHGFHARCTALLRDRSARDTERQAQERYVARVRALPDPAELIAGYVAA